MNSLVLLPVDIPTLALGRGIVQLMLGGLLLFLDEQLYDAATPVERAYFMKVLSSHNVIHHCPVEDFPPSLTDVRVSQVYQFYYICTARKAG